MIVRVGMDWSSRVRVAMLWLRSRSCDRSWLIRAVAYCGTISFLSWFTRAVRSCTGLCWSV